MCHAVKRSIADWLGVLMTHLEDETWHQLALEDETWHQLAARATAIACFRTRSVARSRTHSVVLA
jgi:hypothetical protein